MHPALILIPAAALIFGPRLWVNRVLKKHSREDANLSTTGGDLARELLDRNQLPMVTVEPTDIGDHYDPIAKAVRLTRDKFESKSLTSGTTAAHEVSHALQDASGYMPFVWRSRLVKVAQITGSIGSIVLVSVPATALLTHHTLPPVIVGLAVFSMLGTGLAVQVAAVPTEFDASFGRALPMLRDGYISGQQEKDAKEILFVCSLTYVASSLVAFLNFWPWLGRGATVLDPRKLPTILGRRPASPSGLPVGRRGSALPGTPTGGIGGAGYRPGNQAGVTQEMVRNVGQPLLQSWFRLTRALRYPASPKTP